MSEPLTTRQLNAIRVLLGKQNFTAAEVAAIDYHALRHVQGVGMKSIDGIRRWLIDQGYEMAHWGNGEEAARRTPLLMQRIDRATELLQRYGYTIVPPERQP